MKILRKPLHNPIEFLKVFVLWTFALILLAMFSGSYIGCSLIVESPEPDYDIQSIEDIEKMLATGLTSDDTCVEAAFLANWACNEIGLEADVIELVDDREGHDNHAVCIAFDGEKWHMFQNNYPQHLEFISNSWKIERKHNRP